MVVSVLPYPDYRTCKCRHSTYQHRLVVGFVSVQALTLFFKNRSNVGLNWQISKTLSEAVLAKKGKAPILDFSERLELANSIQYVDAVVGQQNYTPYENVQNIAPNILMESESHDEAQINEGRRLMKELGGRVIVMPYFNDQSSTLIKSKISAV